MNPSNNKELDFEDDRLKSFDGVQWSHTFITPQQLAHAGFYYVGPEDLVQCNFCKLKLSQWKEGDNIEREHKLWEPFCEILMNSEKNRLETFKNWSVEFVDPEILAKIGFFYTGRKDEVKCNFCKTLVCDWKDGDDEILEHFRLSQDCELLSAYNYTANIPIDERDALYKMIEPQAHIAYSVPSNKLKNFANFKNLKPGFYTVKAINIVKLRDGMYAQLELTGGIITIFNLNSYKRASKSRLYELVGVQKKIVTMKKTEDDLYFFEQEKHSLCYHAAEPVQLKKIANGRWYDVLLFSIVDVNDEDRIRVDIEGEQYFLLNEKAHEPIINIDELEMWNKKRIYISVHRDCNNNCHVHFHEK